MWKGFLFQPSYLFNPDKLPAVDIIEKQKINNRGRTQQLQKYDPRCEAHGIHYPCNNPPHDQLLIFDGANDPVILWPLPDVLYHDRLGNVKTISYYQLRGICGSRNDDRLSPYQYVDVVTVYNCFQLQQP